MKDVKLNKIQKVQPEDINGIITLPNNEKIKVGPNAIPFSEAKASGAEILKKLKKAAKEGIFPPIPEINTI